MSQLSITTRFQAKNAEFALTPAEIRRVLRHAPSHRDRLLVEVIAYTGMRRAEARLLRSEDIDLAGRRVLIRHGKGGKARIVYLPHATTRRLRSLLRRTGGYVFPGRSGKPMSLRNINYIFRDLGERAGIANPNPRYSGLTPHLFRHSFARNWKRAGGSLESLQRILGHNSLKTTLDVYGTESQWDIERNYHAVIRAIV